ncbi:MAG: non-ribosomal peptide synthetase, partial [bacterium]|nr:non-ribosomal peptide synthetase [bacterium]
MEEIEKHLLTYPEIKEAVVIARQTEDGDNYLCAYYFVENASPHATESREPTPNLKNFLSRSLPDYMIPPYFIKLEKIPLTPNGKIDRNALPEPTALHTQQQYTPPRNDTEKKLTRIWAETLNIKEKEIGIDSDFFQIGGHSLKATVMATKIHKELNIKLPLAKIFKAPSIRALANTIKGKTQEKYAAIEPVEKKEYYIQSAAQKRLYVLQQMELESMPYNMPRIIPLPPATPGGVSPATPGGEGDLASVEKAFRKLIQRHDSLRTTFRIINGTPVQLIHERVEFKIEYNNHAQNFFRPFELAGAPLLRVRVIESTGTNIVKSGGERFLLIDMHHIITDATSQTVLIKEFFKLYAGECLPPLNLQYKDYTEWQN